MSMRCIIHTTWVSDVDKTMEAIKATGDKPYVIGHIEAGEKGVTLC